MIVDRDGLDAQIEIVAQAIERRVETLADLSNTDLLLYWNGLLSHKILLAQQALADIGTATLGATAAFNRLGVDMTEEVPTVPKRRGRPPKEIVKNDE